MNTAPDTLCTAFEGSRCIASGELAQVALAAKARVDAGAQVLIFDAATSRPIEVDFRGTPEQVTQRLNPPPPRRGPGRPRLGVVAREVTLLPRHWEWLARQPGGASATVRRLVDEARKSGEDKERRRDAQEATYRFMSAMAGNEPGFEEAARALFAGDEAGFEAQSEAWPEDVRDHARWLAARSF